MGRSLLLVTQYYPPSEMVAARRPAGFARYLARLGHRVTVVTSRALASGPPLAGDPATVAPTPDLMSSRLNWRRDNFRAWTGEGGGAAPSYEADASRLARVIVPDVAAVTWLPYMLPAVWRQARRGAFDCVFTTSGPESVHAAGLLLRRRGIGWIADLRDGWTFEGIHDFPPPLDRLDMALERAVMTRADVVTAVSEPIAADLRRRYGADAHALTNGYDPDDFSAVEAEPAAEDGAFTLVHTGRIASGQRTPAPVLEAIRRLRERSPALAARLRLVLAGPLTGEESRLVSASDLEGTVEVLGTVPRARALGLQRSASALLLITSGRSGEATGKLFEYLASERPILVLGDASEAARIVRDTGSGLSVSATDPAAIAEALARLMEGGPPERNGGGVARSAFSYPALAERLAELVELAVERAAARKSSP